jgi:hypothetical protein
MEQTSWSDGGGAWGCERSATSLARFSDLLRGGNVLNKQANIFRARLPVRAAGGTIRVT